MNMKFGLMTVCVTALLSGCASDGYANAEDNARAASVPVVTHGAKVSSNSAITNVGSGISTNQGYTDRSRNVPARLSNAAYNGSNTNGSIVNASSAYAVAAQDATISQDELERLRRLERENVNLRQRNEQLARTSNSGGSGSGNAADLPPNAKKGECYARVLIPGKYETTTERVLDREGSDRVEIIPAEYTWEQQSVLTREASERIEVIPATYKNETQTVEVEPARTELKTVPARYENVSEKILVREAYTTWKKGTGPITKVNEATGEIMCLVEVPAEYRTVVRKELKEPARTDEVFIPAKTRTVTRRVIDQPATTRTVPIPAQYDTVRVRKLVRPAQERRVPIEATYKTVSKQRKITDERLEWREILCETNTTSDVIRRVQVALQREGYRPGGVDGVLGEQTVRALRAYQVDNNLPSGQLTMATVRRLGIQGR